MAKISATWTKLVSTARLQRSSQCLAVLGSNAWIFGGELLPRQPVDCQFDVVKLDAAQEPGSVASLAAPAEAPSARVGSTTIGLNGALYMFSGRGGLAMAPIEEKGALWRYSPGQSLWELILPADPTAPYPAGRSYHTMASDGQNTIYIHAGCPEKGRLSDLWSFNVESATWTELPAAPPPARGGASIAVCRRRRKLYRMNGFDGTAEQGGAIDVFDLDAHAWTTIPFNPDGRNGPEPRSVGALVVVKVEGKDFLVTLFGERDPSSLGHAGAGKMLADVWAFDLAREEWTRVKTGDDAPAPRGWFGADVAQDQSGKDAVIVHGGLAEDNSRLGDVWSLQFE